MQVYPVVPPQVPSGVGFVAVGVALALLDVDDTLLLVDEAIVDEELGHTSFVNFPSKMSLIHDE